MKSSVIPQTFAQWRYCIEVECGIALEPAFIDKRLVELRNPMAEDTRRFASLYGKDHLACVTAWFEQARDGLA